MAGGAWGADEISVEVVAEGGADTGMDTENNAEIHLGTDGSAGGDGDGSDADGGDVVGGDGSAAESGEEGMESNPPSDFRYPALEGQKVHLPY